MPEFTQSAAQLAGHVALLLHWRPVDFWNATPAELATVFAAFAGGDDGGAAATGSDLSRLMEQFPDG